jgi:hypothetical protein
MLGSRRKIQKTKIKEEKEKEGTERECNHRTIPLTASGRIQISYSLFSAVRQT